MLSILNFVTSIDRSASESLLNLDRWISTSRRAYLLLGLLIFTYVVFWGTVTSFRHYHFHSYIDLANHDQVIWNTSQGRPFARSLEVTNDLADHVRPYIALMSLAYIAYPSVYLLLVFQALVLALCAWPLYCLTKRKFDSQAVGLTAACCVLAYPALGFVNRWDFHAEVIVIPLLLVAYERIDARDFKKAGLAMGLALLGKESIGLSVAALGLTVALFHKNPRFGLLWMLIGTAYSFIALFWIIPTIRGEPSDSLARYQWLGTSPFEMLSTMISKPDLLLDRLLTPGNFWTFLQLLAPLAFLPLLDLRIAFPAVPALIYNLASDWPPQRTIYFQYMAAVIPFLILAGISGLHRLASRLSSQPSSAMLPLRSGKGVGLGLSLMLAGTLASWIYENPVTTPPPRTSLGKSGISNQRSDDSRSSSISNYILPNDNAIRDAIKKIPKNGLLLTTDNYLPHLSHRSAIGTVSRSPVFSISEDVATLLLNLRDLRHRSCEDYFQSLRLAALVNFGITFHRDGVLVIEKNKGDSTKLNQLLTRWPGCQ